ncbi:GH36-type glycosyl hydrolase domain-containing protein [Paracoccus aestuariivivens]|uniref:Carbohydrate-binding protein n=1 Tax=Paracoccus aestuariivivens TaxID=1820333 RepID=A0A6L6J607_9RHOB|nr:glucoamylase family protein [Paracoccus aestuariivivens]MTH76966.1 carbohydrate-binding protein [Paracoccus aestuariivivens]
MNADGGEFLPDDEGGPFSAIPSGFEAAGRWVFERGKLQTRHFDYRAARFDVTQAEREQRDCYQAALRADAETEHITTATRWLLDNYHTIAETYRHLHRDLSPGFLRSLPRGQFAGTEPIPRVLALAWDYVALTDGELRERSFSDFIAGAQQVEWLTIGELWCLPSMLRYVLLLRMLRLSLLTETARQGRRDANAAVDRLMAKSDPAPSDFDLAITHDALQNPAFVAQVIYRLHSKLDRSHTLTEKLSKRLELRNSTVEQALIAEQTRQTENNVTAGHVIRSLKRLDEINWREWFEATSRTEAILRDDPDHLRLAPRTRNQIRNRIEMIARHSDLTEPEVAERALAAAGHRNLSVSTVMLGDDAGQFEKACGYRPVWRERLARFIHRHGVATLFAPLIVLVAIAVVSAMTYIPARTGWMLAAGLVILSIPAFVEASLALLRFVASRLIAPAQLPAYGYEDGIPPDNATLVVIPCLLTNLDTIDDVVNNLEVHYLANTDAAISFALLTDFTDAPEETTERDAEMLAYARNGIAALSGKYAHTGHRFFLLHRRRQWNESEGVWMGWERKRGKLVELNALLRGSNDTSFVDTGARPHHHIRYVVTLDADTRMPRETVRTLVGIMAHPVNLPHYDPSQHRITRGHGLIQPRVTALLAYGRQTSPFQRILSQDGGLDPYVFTVSDMYQDLFGQGTYTGKGIYDVDAFIAAAQDPIRANSVLSHDLIEGSWLRSALATDVNFIEEYPRRFDVDLSRHHRWARGDWQLLPYLLDLRNGLDALARFRMVDNLRRSLLPICLMLAGLLALVGLPRRDAVIWLGLLGISMCLAQLLGWLMGLMPRQSGVAPLRHLMVIGNELVDQLMAFMMRLTLLPQTAWSMADAICRTAYRLRATGRNMLEWTTAEVASSRGPETPLGYLYLMRGGVGLALGFTLLVALFRPANLGPTLAFTVLWLGAPLIAWVSARPLKREGAQPLQAKDVVAWRAEARLIWRFFETFVTERTNHLPPDNYQIDPEPKLAERTSPTNIGLYLLSIVTAREFNWITLTETLERIEASLGSVEKMERHRGHLFNWYATDTLDPIGMRYISAVDSGNLAGHLITLSSTLREWSRNPALYLLPDLSGAADILTIMRRIHSEIPRERRSLNPLRKRIDEHIEGLWNSISNAASPQLAPLQMQTNARASADLQALVQGLLAELPTPAARELDWWANRLVTTCDEMEALGRIEPALVQVSSLRMAALAERARAIAFEMDFSFLYDAERHLLSIGYNCNDGTLDNAYYDLMASEARLASLFGIAKGDVPTEHWNRLGRPMTVMAYGSTLVSWSGSMFEYLMAPLIMDEPPGSILHSSCEVAVEAQIRDGARQGRPWGVSESAYSARDAMMNYQYHAFGVPELALRRWLRDDQVVAPYATFIAAGLRPKSALKNLQKLAKLGARGEFGFFDAVDFTPSRLPEGRTSVIVCNVMAHHQGMSLLAIANCLMDGIHRDRFHADPVIESVSTLLQQRAPREVSPLLRITPTRKAASTADEGHTEIVEVKDTKSAPHTVALMSNGRQSLLLDASGGGRSRAGSTAVTRWRPDPAADIWGEFLFLRDTESGRWWSATAAPAFDPQISYSARLFDYKANFTAVGDGIYCETEVILSDDLDARGTRVKLRNLGDQPRRIELTSFGEIVLDDNEADRAHTAFSRMFVATEAQPEQSRVFARRNKRNPHDPDRHLLHMSSGAGIGTTASTDRRSFVGRGRTVREPLGMVDPARLEPAPQGESYTLDPIFSLTRQLTLAPGKEAVATFWTVFGTTREQLEEAHHHLSDEAAFDNEHQMAWTRSQVQLHHADITPEEAALFRRYAALLVYPNQAMNPHQIRHAMGPQSSLWPMSVSGDNPIMVLRINDPDLMPVAHQAIRMQEYLRMRGLDCDLVILNEQRASYAASTNEALNNLCHSMHLLHSRPSVFAVDANATAQETLETLLAVARVVVHAQNGPLSEQIGRIGWDELQRGIVRPAPRPLQRPAHTRDFPPEELRFWNGTGGFDAKGNYVTRLRHGETTPNPWINVIARTDFGFHISAEGAAFSWSANSRDHQLTPWSNDPVSNPSGEGLLIRDVGTGAVHTPYAMLSSQRAALYQCRHGAGFSEFSSWSGELEIRATHSIMPDAAMRIIGLAITNHADRRMTLDVAQFLEPVMGGSRAKAAPYLQPRYMPKERAIECENPYSIDYAGQRMVLSVDRDVTGMCLSRLIWKGRNRDLCLPAWFDSTMGHRFVHRHDGDPVMMLETRIEIEPGETANVTFRLAAGVGSQAERLVAHPATVSEAMVAQEQDWWKVFGQLEVETPDPAFDLMVNRWLPYQAIACRIRARTAFFQASGAYGFRDQLQDTSAMLIYDPDLARAQLLEAASRQFPEGDVQHWWLPGSGAGVRTMIADDVVWLGNCLTRYLDVTGDHSILDEELPFIQGRLLADGEHDAFFTPETSHARATVYEHAALALELAVKRTGDRGLPLFLGGDWNDGMNRVGEAGQGQSVWLGWFLTQTLDLMAPLAEARGDWERASAWRAHRAALCHALDANAWDGGWYLRGIYDDGSPLGSGTSEECRIDSIAQSWSVIAGAGRADRRTTAVDAALAHLLDEKGMLLRLFTPAFAHTVQDPGYIKGYPPGVRENGGQYTHAAIWMVQALCLAGRNDDAWRVFTMLNPISHSSDPDTLKIYRAEPYVVAADVYGADEKIGRGGWTWYTGSAGWLHRVAVEHILGLRIRGGTELEVSPVLPSHWPGYRARIMVGGTLRNVEVSRADDGQPRVEIR